MSAGRHGVVILSTALLYALADIDGVWRVGLLIASTEVAVGDALERLAGAVRLAPGRTR